MGDHITASFISSLQGCKKRRKFTDQTDKQYFHRGSVKDDENDTSQEYQEDLDGPSVTVPILKPGADKDSTSPPSATDNRTEAMMPYMMLPTIGASTKAVCQIGVSW
jgi:hypothetical protein